MDAGALVLLPEADVRKLAASGGLAGGRPLVWRLLRPPYPALGAGALRVLRLLDRSGVTELIAGYESYERSPAYQLRGHRAGGS